MLKDFYKFCQNTPLAPIADELLHKSQDAFAVNNGNIPKWEAAINELQAFQSGVIDFQHPYVRISSGQGEDEQLTAALRQLMPWRKGPYQIGETRLESEWRGDMKWDRLLPHIEPLKDKLVLDVGSGNGYFTYLMALAGAKLALGIEPFLLFNYQFKALQSLANNPPAAFVLPLKLEQMPEQALFDTVFSMGVLYHQKQHMVHLEQLKSVLKTGGELVLETLIIEPEFGDELIPKDRYARMRNVWCLPTTDTLSHWLEQAGFRNIRLADVNQTSIQEQRATHWIGDNTQSLKDFLDPHNENLTIEGLPAPRRAIFIANK